MPAGEGSSFLPNRPACERPGASHQRFAEGGQEELLAYEPDERGLHVSLREPCAKRGADYPWRKNPQPRLDTPSKNICDWKTNSTISPS